LKDATGGGERKKVVLASLIKGMSRDLCMEKSQADLKAQFSIVGLASKINGGVPTVRYEGLDTCSSGRRSKTSIWTKLAGHCWTPCWLRMSSGVTTWNQKGRKPMPVAKISMDGVGKSAPGNGCSNEWARQQETRKAYDLTTGFLKKQLTLRGWGWLKAACVKVSSRAQPQSREKNLKKL